MSQLVAKWDRSYQFTDEELAAFIDVQNNLGRGMTAKKLTELEESLIDHELCQQLNLPVGGLVNFSEWTFCQDRDESYHFMIPAELKANYKRISLLNSSLQSLMLNTQKLREGHEEVKGRAEGMQQLWEDLLNQRATFERFAEKIEERLGAFTQFGRLEEELRIADPMIDILKDGFQTALRTVIGNALIILEKPGYKEAQVNMFRYKQLLNSAFGAFKTLFDRRMTELNLLCREQDSSIDYAGLLEMYKNIAVTVRPLLESLENAMVLDNQLAHLLHECMSKFLAARFNLAKRGRRPSTVEETFDTNDAKHVFMASIEMLHEEQELFRLYFGCNPMHQRHFEYFCEQVLIPLLQSLRQLIDAQTEGQKVEFKSWLECSADGSPMQTRMTKLVLEYM